MQAHGRTLPWWTRLVLGVVLLLGLAVPIHNKALATPSAGTLQFSAATYTGAESAGPITVTVTRTGGSTGIVSVDFARTDSNPIIAVNGPNCQPIGGTLVFGDGDTTAKTFTVFPVDRNIAHGTAAVTLALSNPTGGATLGTQSTTTVTQTLPTQPNTYNNNDVRLAVDCGVNYLDTQQAADGHFNGGPAIADTAFALIAYGVSDNGNFNNLSTARQAIVKKGVQYLLSRQDTSNPPDQAFGSWIAEGYATYETGLSVTALTFSKGALGTADTSIATAIQNGRDALIGLFQGPTNRTRGASTCTSADNPAQPTDTSGGQSFCGGFNYDFDFGRSDDSNTGFGLTGLKFTGGVPSDLAALDVNWQRHIQAITSADPSVNNPFTTRNDGGGSYQPGYAASTGGFSSNANDTGSMLFGFGYDGVPATSPNVVAGIKFAQDILDAYEKYAGGSFSAQGALQQKSMIYHSGNTEDGSCDPSAAGCDWQVSGDGGFHYSMWSLSKGLGEYISPDLNDPTNWYSKVAYLLLTQQDLAASSGFPTANGTIGSWFVDGRDDVDRVISTSFSIFALGLAGTPPPPVVNFGSVVISAGAACNDVHITFTPPNSPNYGGLTIVRNTNHPPTSLSDGTIVAQVANPGNSFDDTNLPAGATTIYYAGFPYDTTGEVLGQPAQTQASVTTCTQQLSTSGSGGVTEGSLGNTATTTATSTALATATTTSTVPQPTATNTPQPSSTTTGSAPATAVPSVVPTGVLPITYFAEGYTGTAAHNGKATFSQHLALFNNTTNTANVQITYFTIDPDTGKHGMVTAQQTVNPGQTISRSVNADILNDLEVSTEVAAPSGVTAEMVFSRTDPTGATLDTATNMGVTEPATNWYLAEGYTSESFQEYLQIFNPGNTDAMVTVHYLPSDSNAPTVSAVKVAAHDRLTINVRKVYNGLVPHGSRNVAISVISDQPVVVDRSLYWGDFSGSGKFGSSVGSGIGQGQTSQYFGYLSGTQGGQSFIAVFNPNTDTANLTLTLRDAGGATIKTMTASVAGGQRHTFVVENVTSGSGKGQNPLQIGTASGDLESDLPVVAETSVYFNGSPNRGKNPGILEQGSAGATTLTWAASDNNSRLFLFNPTDSDAQVQISTGNTLTIPSHTTVAITVPKTNAGSGLQVTSDQTLTGVLLNGDLKTTAW